MGRTDAAIERFTDGDPDFRKTLRMVIEDRMNWSAPESDPQFRESFVIALKPAQQKGRILKDPARGAVVRRLVRLKPDTTGCPGYAQPLVFPQFTHL